MFKLGNGKVRGLNTVTCKVQTGEARYYVVGCYMPPSDKEGKNLEDIMDAMNKMSRAGFDSHPLRSDILNINIC